ncbi:MAG: tol-pal system protein YbgF [Nitrospirales bacterium]
MDILSMNGMKCVRATIGRSGLLVVVLMAGCAKHADFVDLREDVTNLTKAQEQTQKRQDALQRRLETGKPIPVDETSKGHDASAQRIQELTSRLADLESRLSRLEDGKAAGSGKLDESRQALSSTSTTPPRSSEPQESSAPPSLAGTPGISPTSAFNLAYNDYLNGRYDLAVTGFQRFLKDFPATSLAPNAYYWMGESYFSLKDYPHAAQAFQRVVNDHPRSEKVAPALFKMGVVTAEAGDLPKARGYLRRVIEDFSTSDEAKLAKNKLAEIR